MQPDLLNIVCIDLSGLSVQQGNDCAMNPVFDEFLCISMGI